MRFKACGMGDQLDVDALAEGTEEDGGGSGVLEQAEGDGEVALEARIAVAKRELADSRNVLEDTEKRLDAERRAVQACSGTKDQIEGMTAFMEKRRPVFSGE